MARPSGFIIAYSSGVMGVPVSKSCPAGQVQSGYGMAKRELKIPLTERLGIIRLGHEDAIGILV